MNISKLIPSVKRVGFLFFSFFIFLIGCTGNRTSLLFRIYDGSVYGFIDSTGKVIITPQFKFVGSFQEELAIVSDDADWEKPYAFINTKGDTVLRPSSQLRIDPLDLYPFSKTRFDFNKSYLPAIVEEFAFSGGLALMYDRNKKKFGYMNKEGEVVIQPQFLNASKFRNGYAIVQTAYDTSNWENTHTGLIDSTGKMVIADKYYAITRFSNNLAIASIATKKGEGYSLTGVILNKKGNIINTVTAGFPVFGEYSGSYVACYDGFMSSFLKTGGYFIMDSKGEILKDNANGEALYFEDVKINRGKYFWYKRNNKYGWFILSDNHEIKIIDTKLYDDIKSGFNREGIACIRYAEFNQPIKFGFIDTLGNFIIKPKYYTANDFRGPLASVSLKNGNIKISGYINKTGEFVWSREIRDTTSAF